MSIDVALGAVVCAAFFASMLNVSLRPAGLAALGVSVWIIYSVDHLLDAHLMKRQASTHRHRFHQENFGIIAAIVFLAIIADLVLIVYIRRPLLLWGVGLGVLVFLYLFLHRFINPGKEILVAILYSGGVLLPALSLHTMPMTSTEILLVISFAITALINLVLFSWFEWDHDMHNAHRSLVTYLGKQHAQVLIMYLFIAQTLLFGVITSGWHYQFELLILILMNSVLWILFRFPARFGSNNRYRLLGDLIFMIPAIYLFWR